jgi:hypothetical protein
VSVQTSEYFEVVRCLSAKGSDVPIWLCTPKVRRWYYISFIDSVSTRSIADHTNERHKNVNRKSTNFEGLESCVL